jgi:hypothetical protein
VRFRSKNVKTQQLSESPINKVYEAPRITRHMIVTYCPLGVTYFSDKFSFDANVCMKYLTFFDFTNHRFQGETGCARQRGWYLRYNLQTTKGRNSNRCKCEVEWQRHSKHVSMKFTCCFTTFRIPMLSYWIDVKMSFPLFRLKSRPDESEA